MQATANQSLQDLSVMMTGTIEAMFEVAAGNNSGITDDPVLGTDYALPSTSVTDAATLQYLRQNGIVIGTMSNGIGTGIGYWKIGSTFKIA
jgi:hypothetical protein